MKEKREKLFTEFPAVSRERWMEVVTADLKGKPFDKKLVWRTNEGFELMPFYRADDIEDLPTINTLPGVFPYVRGTKADNNWLVRQEIEVGDNPEVINAKLKDLMTRGITAVGLHFEKSAVNVDTVKSVLDGISLDQLEVNYYSCNRFAVTLAEAVVEAYKALGVNLDTARGSINFNPFRKILNKGIECENWLTNSVEVLNAIKPLKNFTGITFRAVDLVNAGAYIYQELGYSLAAGADLLEKISEKSGASIGDVARRMRFDMGVGTNYFMEIAKFRAMRWLWATIVKANDDNTCDEDAKALVHAETGLWNKTIYDAYVNLLRTQTESMSAILGGVHSLTVVPFDKTFSEGSAFSERIARNQQLLLKEESHFDKVVDPAGGSYYVEHLTNSIAEQAWKLFLEVEEMGGFAVAAAAGNVQEAVNSSNAKRHKAIATRRESLLGTNIFPNITETATAEKLAVNFTPVEGGNVAALNKSRGASDFEALRMATERSEKTPKVFMLTIGNLAMRLARSQFSSNFFGVAGYQIIDNLGFKTVKEGVDAARKAGADIICLCSSDEEYAEFGPQAYDEIAGEMPLVIAGAPACMEELKAKGIEHFVHVKVNVLETMQNFSRMLGLLDK